MNLKPLKMQNNPLKSIGLSVGPCEIEWIWETDDEGPVVTCSIFYEEVGTQGARLIGQAWSRCSKKDLYAGKFNEQKGLQIALKKALIKASEIINSHTFKTKIWFAFRDNVGWPKRKYKPTQKETKLPKDIIGHTFFYKGENYTVTNIVWGKAPRAKNQSNKGYWKKGEQPGKRKWVEYVEYEPHRGAEQRFVRPKAEFLSKFGICKLVENVRIIEDFPDVDPTPNLGSDFSNFN